MATWNELFKDRKLIAKVPQPEVYKFALMLEKKFQNRPLRIWDVCCGAGRHTSFLSELGHDIYGSDNAENALSLTNELLESKKLSANLKLSDMTVCPWHNIKFHGALSWDAIHHNTLSNIQKAIDTIYEKLLPGGLFIATIKSDKEINIVKGKEIEPNTIVFEEGYETGVPHHYFDEKGIKKLFKKWKIILLVEQIFEYVETGDRFWEYNPFAYSTWGIVAEKQEK